MSPAVPTPAAETQEQLLSKSQGIIDSLPPEIVERLIASMFSGSGISRQNFEPVFVPPTATTTTGTGTGTTAAAPPASGDGMSAAQKAYFDFLVGTNSGGHGEDPQATADYVKSLSDFQSLSSLSNTADPSDRAPFAPDLSATEAMAYLTDKYGLGASNYAQGGLASLKPKGYYLGGATDGMADEIPANIEGRQEAALSDGEFVIPADVVSHLGNGNSNAGAKQLYDMMERIRKARTGTPEQGKRVNPAQFVPK
jgi:hypothetical protein